MGFIDVIMPEKALTEIADQLRKLNMNLSEGVAAIKAAKDQLIKAREEITAKLTKLEDALAHIDVPPEDAMAAIEELKAVVQSLDDIVPDVAEPTPEEPAA